MKLKLVFFMGTAAELIKMYPVLLETEKRQIEWTAISSGQSSESFLQQWHEFQLPENKLIELNPNAKGLKKTSSAILWFASTFFLKLRKVNKLLPEPGNVIVVHGDTLSTLLGSLFAKLMGKTLIHIESGLTSHSLFNPFPEEMTRRICCQLANMLFSPNEIAFQNLIKKNIHGKVFNTHFNTMYESLTYHSDDSGPNVNQPYVLCNIHRFENLINDNRFDFIIRTIEKVSALNYKILFVMHAQTRHKLESSEKWKTFFSNSRIEFQDRLSFTKFRKKLFGASFVITDGGSNQEECFYLGKPCLIMRNATERNEGLEENCLLSKFDSDKVTYFLNNIEKFRRPSIVAPYTPSAIILDEIAKEALE